MKIKLLLLSALLAFEANSQGLAFLKKSNERRLEKRDTRWNVEKIYKNQQLGLSFQTVLNENFAANQYPGFLLSSESSSVREMPKKLFIFDNNLGGGVLSLPRSQSPTISFNSRLSHSLLFKINKTMAVGAQFSGIFNTRVNTNNENNSVAGEGIIDLGPRVRFSKDLNLLGDIYTLQYHLTLPIVAFGASFPAYSISFDLKGVKKGLFLPNSYQRIQSQASLTLPHSKRFINRSYKFGYSWDYLHLDLGNKRSLFNAVHTIGIIGSVNKIK